MVHAVLVSIQCLFGLPPGSALLSCCNAVEVDARDGWLVAIVVGMRTSGLLGAFRWFMELAAYQATLLAVGI